MDNSTVEARDTTASPHTLQRILVGVDGSDGSRRAAMVAREMARAFDAQLTLLHVVEPLPSAALTAFGEPHSELYARQEREGAALLRGLADELGVSDAEQVIDTGRPADVICREADERAADLIVVGSHGHGPAARLLIGSVGSRVAALAKRSVTIVR
jgi:universal stress protein A